MSFLIIAAGDLGSILVYSSLFSKLLSYPRRFEGCWRGALGGPELGFRYKSTCPVRSFRVVQLLLDIKIATWCLVGVGSRPLLDPLILRDPFSECHTRQLREVTLLMQLRLFTPVNKILVLVGGRHPLLVFDEFIDVCRDLVWHKPSRTGFACVIEVSGRKVVALKAEVGRSSTDIGNIVPN